MRDCSRRHRDRGHGQLRGRKPRRSQHPVGRSPFSTPTSAERSGCSRRRAPQACGGSCRSRPTRSTDRWGRPARSRRRRRISPRSPYSASKAAADHFVHGLSSHARDGRASSPAARTTTGPYQFPEKLIPLMILNAFEGKPLPVYGDGLYVRDWIHVDDHCEAIDAALAGRRGRRGLQHRRRERAPQPRRRARHPAPRGPGRIADSPRPRPPGPRPPLRHELAQDPRASSAGARATGSRRGWPRPWPGTAPTAPGRDRVRSGAYRDYYERQYAGAPGAGAGGSDNERRGASCEGSCWRAAPGRASSR